MAIYGIGGKPGGGKTYFCCHHLTKKYYEWDKLHNEFMRRFPLEIITNIDELKLDHFPLDEMIFKSGQGGKDGNVETFFNVDYQRKLLSRFARLVYIIDEAGRFFPSGYKEKDVLFFFQYHRHLGIDIYLVSSALDNISKGIINLMEYRLIAKERSKRVLSEFRYVKYIGLDKVSTMILKPDNKIFSLYKSMMLTEQEKIPSVTRRMLLIGLMAVLSGILLFRYTIAYMGDRNDPGKKAKTQKSSTLQASNEKQVEKKESSIPLAEQSLKVSQRVSLKVRGVNDIEFDELLNDFMRVHVFKCEDGRLIVAGEDGSLYRQEEIPVMLRSAVVLDGSVYVRKKRGYERAGGVSTGSPEQSLKKVPTENEGVALQSITGEGKGLGTTLRKEK